MSDRIRSGVIPDVGVGDEPTPLFLTVPLIDLAPCSRCGVWSDLTDGDFKLCADCEEKVRFKDEQSF